MYKSSLVAPSDLTTANHATPKYTPGQEWYQDPKTGAVYRYVKVTVGGTHANTLITGRPVYWDVMSSGSTLTDAAGTDKLFAGVLLGAVTSTNYTWIQTQGQAQVLITNSLTANSPLIADDANGCLKIAGAATDVVLGTNLVAGNNPATPATTKCVIGNEAV